MEQQQQQQETFASHISVSAAEQFSEGVGTILMATEELRRSVVSATATTTPSEQQQQQKHDGIITIFHLIQWQHELQGLLATLSTLDRWIQDYAADTSAAAPEQYDLFRHCQYKAVVVAQQVLNAALQFVEPTDADEGDDEETARQRGLSATVVAENPPEQVRRDAQAAIARITELNLLLCHSYHITSNKRGEANSETHDKVDELETAEEIVQSYVTYQRTVLRLRARPAIAELVEARQNGRIITPPAIVESTHEESPGLSSTIPGGQHMKVIHHHHDDEEEEEDDGVHTANQPQIPLPEIQPFHAPVLTVILSEAAALIHPLLAWQLSLPPAPPESLRTDDDDTENLVQQQQQQEPPIVTSIRKLCQDSVTTLDEQAQSLVKRVSDWYWEDRPIDTWMQRSVDDNTGQDQTSPEQRQRELAILDGLVSEMKFACEVQARYQSLIQAQENLQTVIAKELLPEWTWKYAALERYLVMQQWQSALETAIPFDIKIGTKVQVPSVVEDAQYLSTRALERAASTRSLQAIGTVAYAVSHDVWSMDMNTGVFQALMDRRGCWSEPVEEKKKESDTSRIKRNDSKNDFASALLDALDDDLGPNESRRHETAPSSNPSRAPTSGGFLSSLVGGGDKMKQIQLDTQFCALNGIYAAAGACRSLVVFLDDLLSPDDEDAPLPAADSEKASSMIQLAREELSRYADGYQTMLTNSIEEAVKEWCGSGRTHDSSGNPLRAAKENAFDRLCLFIKEEPYNLSAKDFSKLEADERLERELIGPLKQSLFLDQIPNRCDEDILRETGEHLASVLANLIIECLWESEKKFSDWGSLLLSKQLRLLQVFVSRIASPVTDTDAPILSGAPSLIYRWERLSQVVTVLQLEKPSDWLAYQPSSQLSPDELHRTLSLRVDFSIEAIESTVSTVRKQVEGSDQKS